MNEVHLTLKFAGAGGGGRFSPPNSYAPRSHVPSAPRVVPVGVRLYGEVSEVPAGVLAINAKLRFVISRNGLVVPVEVLVPMEGVKMK